MADFPNAIAEFREMNNIPQMTYDPEKKTTIYAEDFQKMQDEIIALENFLGVDGVNVWPIGTWYVNRASASNPTVLGMPGTWVLRQAGDLGTEPSIWERTA